MNYKSTSEIAIKWGTTPQKVSSMCSKGLINGAYKNSNKWLVPENAIKPNRLITNDCSKEKSKFRFIDLFAGIGGFHQAMRYLGGTCVFASEINKACIETYEANFKTEYGGVAGDINNIDPLDIPEFEVLCGGFPCQPFSKAGLQKGFDDEKSGNLFYAILNILDVHEEVQFLVLENVRNLADKTENWEIIRQELSKRNFIITKDALILSPSDFGIPQIRERVYILGIKKDYCSKKIVKQGYIKKEDLNLEPYYKKCKIGDALSILETNVPDSYVITSEQYQMIKAWDEFRINTGMKTIGYPIWISCFGVGIDNDREFKKTLGYNEMPEWKKNFVDKNRVYYLNNKEFIDQWIRQYDMLNRNKVYQKFEWNCGEDVNDMKDAIIQIRQSGIRCKRTTFFPSLVAIINTPIVCADKYK